MRSRRGENVDMSSLRCFDGFITLMVGHLPFSHSRTGIAAGSPVPIDLMKSLISKLNLKDLTNAYGMSELLFLTTLF
jgi:acyl-CoA synthetase (AMP-forming)/AMP-acid ligase II